MIEISAIIPAYNKEKVVEVALSDIYTELKKLGLSFEMIIVNDGSTDKTKEKIEKFCKTHPEASLLDLQKNAGKGKAIIYGFNKSKGKLVFFMDGDTDIAPGSAPVFLEYMIEQKADVVVGSKNHPHSKIRYPPERQVLSRVYQTFCFMMFSMPVSDTQVGFKLYKREVLETVLPKVLVKKFAFPVEILAVAHKYNYKIVEAPIELRESKFSAVNPRAIGRMFVDTCAIGYRMHIVKQYDKK